MPTAVIKAAKALNDAKIIVEVLMDFDVANLRALEMAAVAAVIFDCVAAW